MKRNTMIFIIIILFAIGIIIGILLKENKKISDKSELETLKTQLEESNNKINQLEAQLKAAEENDNKSIQTEEQLNSDERSKEIIASLLEEKEIQLNGFIEDENKQKIVNNVMNNFFKYSFYMHSNPYCGEYANNDYYVMKDNSSYLLSKTYNNINEIKTFYKTFLSERYIDENLMNFYIEKENELYCYCRRAGALIYLDGEHKIISISEDKIEVYSIINADNIGSTTIITSKATLIKENNNWVVDEYKEFY